MSWNVGIPNPLRLDRWVKDGWNVCFHGRHGTGKTSVIKDTFERQKNEDGSNWKMGEDYLIFSGATMDPWVDFIGVPTESKDKDGSFLELVRPKYMRNKNLKAIFVDEYNRSNKKIRNAVMELIQFKSINGNKFPNLQVVWGAVNPEDDADFKYDVEKMDPAQADRFHIHVVFPTKPNLEHFVNAFGQEWGNTIVKYWEKLPDKIQKEISPRRLEYALRFFEKEGELEWILPSEANLTELKQQLENGCPEKTFRRLIAHNRIEDLRKWIAFENNFAAVKRYIGSEPETTKIVLPLLASDRNSERVMSLIVEYAKIWLEIKSNPKPYKSILQNLSKYGQNEKMKKDATKLLSTIDSIIDVNLPITKMKDMKISPRKIKQIESNYTLGFTGCETLSNKEPKDIVSEIQNISLALSLESNDDNSKISSMKDLSKVVHEKMTEHQGHACLKICEFLHSTIEDKGLLEENPIFIKTINTILQSLNKDGFQVSSILPLAPNLIVNVLVANADAIKIDEKSVENKTCFVKSFNKKWDNISDEIEVVSKVDEIEL